MVVDEASSSLEVLAHGVDLVGELPLDFLGEEGSLFVEVVVSIHLVVFHELRQTNQLILAKDAREVEAFLDQLFLLDLVLGEDARELRVVGLAQGIGDDLQEEPEEMDLSLFYLADAGYAVHLLEV